MATFPVYLRLEPRPEERPLEAGFAATVHDPVWFLARQWQMGEHQGENASSPVWSRYDLVSRPIHAADPRFDPTVIPAEAIVESELDDWWTMGRRVRIGRRFAAHPGVVGREDLLFTSPPPPYERFEGLPDGLALWRRRGDLGIGEAEFGAEIPPDSVPAWDSAQLLYDQVEASSFATDQERLSIHRHRGGRLDWHSVDGTAILGQLLPDSAQREAIPTALTYPGAPSSRWWQIENAEVDVGGYVPDSAHTATAILTDLVFSHSDDWFLLPVVARAGSVVAITFLEVLDGFGRTYTSAEVDGDGTPTWAGLQPPPDWTLFKVDSDVPGNPGLAREDLVLWHVAELPLEGGPLERVQFGLDEESNLLWAVERTVDGREVESRPLDASDSPRFNDGPPSGDATGPRHYAYVPAEGIVPRWHPYVVSDDDGSPRRLVQQRLVDLSRQRPTLMPAPEAEVLQPPIPGELHAIAPLAVPSNGIEVDRRWMLARDMDGQPVLWLQRQRRPLLSPPARRLRFDVMEVAAEN
jgi:hypothetical protein